MKTILKDALIIMAAILLLFGCFAMAGCGTNCETKYDKLSKKFDSIKAVNRSLLNEKYVLKSDLAVAKMNYYMLELKLKMDENLINKYALK